MRRIIESFLRGYKLSLENFKWGANLSKEKRTYKELLERREWQKPRKTGLNGFSKFGGYICMIIHFKLAYRMHKATNQMLKDKPKEKD